MRIKDLLLSMAILFLGYTASANCDATFSTASLGAGSYQFSANYTTQSSYTYADRWVFDVYGTYNGQASVIQTFWSSGTYHVCHYLTVQDSLGHVVCNDSSCQSVVIVIPQQCQLSFGAYPSTSPASTSVTFTNTITDYTNLKLVWQFGDGSSAGGVASPTHTYPAWGTYYYCLYVTDTVLHCADSSCNYVQVDSVSPCQQQAFLQYTQPLISSDSVVLWQYTASGPNVITNWDFGDGTTYSGDSYLSHIYPAAGQYTVYVNCIDTATQCSSSGYLVVNVDSCSGAFANFSWNGVQNSPHQIACSLDSTSMLPYGTPVSWTFSNATVVDSSNINYAVAWYNSTGTYNVCVTVQPSGCSAVQYCTNITVGCNLDSNFSYNMVNGNTISYAPEMASYYYNPDTNVVYLWTFGDGAISTEVFPTHVYSDTGAYNTCLIIRDTLFGCADTLCQQVVYMPWNDTICGTVFVDANGNGIQDSGEIGLPHVLLNCYPGNGSILQMVTDANGNYQLSVPLTNYYLYVYTNLPANTIYSLPFGYYATYFNYQFTAANQRQCGFDFGLAQGFVTVAGTVFGDDNHNGILDNNEIGIPNQLVDIGSQQVVTQGNGTYMAYVDTGSYNIQKDASGFFAANANLPASIPVYIPNYFGIDTGLNIGVQTQAGIHDVAIDLIPLTPIVPGWESFYSVQVTNLSSNPEFLTDSMTIDPAMQFDYYYGSYSTINGVTNTANWLSGSVQGFGITSTLGANQASAALTYNQDIYSSAGVAISGNTDNNPANNTDSCHQIVVAPYDPNNKASNQAGKTSLGYISNGQELKYTIEFQNTGTGDAINVIVKDVLDANFDLKTFRFISSVYPGCDVRLVGDTVYFRFSQIMLPPALQGNPASIGYVSFAITPKPSLVPGTQLHNNAAIYFDRNTPVITNTTRHTIEQPTDIKNITDDGRLFMAPNPFSTQLNFRLQNMPADKYNYEITDVLGRVVTAGITTNGQTTTIYRNTLSAGTYIITFFTADGIAKRGKIVAE